MKLEYNVKIGRRYRKKLDINENARNLLGKSGNSDNN